MPKVLPIVSSFTINASTDHNSPQEGCICMYMYRAWQLPGVSRKGALSSDDLALRIPLYALYMYGSGRRVLHLRKYSTLMTGSR